MTLARRDACASGLPQEPHVHVMATHEHWLACFAVGETNRCRTRSAPRRGSPTPRIHPLAPSSAPDKMSLMRSAVYPTIPPQPSPAPACQRAAPVSEPAEPTSRTIPCQGTRVGVAPAPRPSRRQRALASQGTKAATVHLSRNPVSLPPGRYYVK
jgi:hypothetical protein